MGLAKKFVFGGRGRKGSVKRETRRNSLPLKPARSLKGSVNGEVAEIRCLSAAEQRKKAA